MGDKEEEKGSISRKIGIATVLVLWCVDFLI